MKPEKMIEMTESEYSEKIGELAKDKNSSGLITIIENSKNKNILASAIYALGELKADDAVDLLIYIALKRNWAKIRHEAILALGKIGNEKAIKPLAMLLKDSDYKVTEPEEDYCSGSDGFMPGAIIGALCDIGSPKAIDRIVEVLDGNSKLTEIAVQVLKEKGEKGVFPIIRLLECDDHLTVREAVEALGDLGKVAQPATEYLVSLLATGSKMDNPNFELMEAIVIALGKLQDVKTIEPLLKILNPTPSQTDNDYALQCMLITALGEIGDKRVTKPLLHIMLNGIGLRIRGTAAMALGKICDEAAIEPLIKVLENEREEGWVKDCAFKALFNYSGDIAAVPILSAAQFLKLRGCLKSDCPHPKAERRPHSDITVLRDILKRLRELDGEVA